jgi:transcriptional regulator with XRE-family HTH domain
MPTVRADVVTRLREAKGWSQEMLARKALVEPKTLSNMLTGRRPPRLSTIAKIAKALGVEPGELIEGHDPEPPPDAAANRVEVRLVLSIPYKGLEQSEGLRQLVGLISSLVQAKHAISVVDASPGSVILTLKMSEEDVYALIKAAMALKLDEIGFSLLHVLDEDFEMPDNLPPILSLNEIFRLRKKQREKSRKKPGAKDRKRKKPNDL